MSSEVVIALSSTVIALCALAVSIWQGILSRQQQRKSVTPFLSVSHNSLNYESIDIYLKNNGLGPAVLTKYVIDIKGKKINIQSESDIYNFINALNLGKVEAEIYVPEAGSYVAIGSEILLLSIKPLNSEIPYSELREILFGCVPEIEYESIYGEKYSTKKA